MLQEASQQRVAAFKVAAHLSQPVHPRKGSKKVTLHASSRNVDIGLHTSSASGGHARSASHDLNITHPVAAMSALCDVTFTVVARREDCFLRHAFLVLVCTHLFWPSTMQDRITGLFINTPMLSTQMSSKLQHTLLVTYISLSTHILTLSSSDRHAHTSDVYVPTSITWCSMYIHSSLAQVSAWQASSPWALPEPQRSPLLPSGPLATARPRI